MMTLKKLLKGIFIGITCLLSATFVVIAHPYSKKPRIAITQITSHPTLDKIRQGVMDSLSVEGFTDKKTAHISYANAQGDITTAVQIAHNFVSDNPDVIIAIATPSAQAIAQVIRNTDNQLIFSSVTDPLGASLVTNLEHPEGNISGTISAVPLTKFLGLIKLLQPEIKNIGVLLNYGEENSTNTLKELKEIAKSNNIEVLEAPVSSSGEVQSATQSLVKKVDSFLLIGDNTVASGDFSLLQVARNEGVPVYSTFVEAVELGALIGLTYDEYNAGFVAGKMAAEVLKGKKAGNLAIRTPHEVELVVNLKSANLLNIKIPEDILKEARTLYN